MSLLITYNNLIRRCNDIEQTLKADVALADRLYSSQFTDAPLDKTLALVRLQKLYDAICEIVANMKLVAEDLLVGDVINHCELEIVLSKMLDVKNTTAMTLNILSKRPTQSLVFTDWSGHNLFRWDFDTDSPSGNP